ncbi:MAG: HAD hydrolase family protein, partial [Verrucomicrobia bacterium]|nr:HAD hydrolase family protein [Verrucomicrobiota bacterium]
MSISMGNGSEAVQAEAHFVSHTNEEEGFAYAMETFVLGRKA